MRAARYVQHGPQKDIKNTRGKKITYKKKKKKYLRRWDQF
jgi:hypothetical protein